MSRTKTINHGRYTIKAMQMKGDWQARAYLTGAKTGSGEIARAAASDEATAVNTLREELNARERHYKSARRIDERTSLHAIPTTDEYLEALSIADFHEAQREMLKSHCAAGDTGMTATELAASAGYTDFSSANLQYGKAGRLIAEAIGIEIPYSKKGDTVVPTCVIAHWIAEPDSSGRVDYWVMHPELRTAIERLPL